MGIYVHIPFCRSKCYYCGFYSVASTQLKKAYIAALGHEIQLRKDYLGTSEVKTLYFGGGTPSWLSMDELTDIVTTLEMNFALNCVAERTIEANPEDITRDKLKGWRALGFNRLSIGIQSFNDEVLKRINRTHTAQDALRSVEWAADSGFENIGIDLILGLPGYTRLHLQHDLEIVNHLPITHLSVYLLSIDSNTVFEKLMQKGRFQPQTDDELADQYLWVSDYLKSIGFEHYEISNFCRPGKYSRHNTSYWQGISYLGCGPSAHSFNGMTREWNVSSIDLYIKGIEENQRAFEIEHLDLVTRYNEFIITTIRTVWGTPIEKLQQTFGHELWEYCRKMAAPYLENGKLEVHDGALRLTREGIFISDSIMSDLLWVD